MNTFTRIMAMLGAFGPQTETTSRPFYPYPLGKQTNRSNGRASHNLSYTKKGPGRRHRQGVSDHKRCRARKLRSCAA